MPLTLKVKVASARYYKQVQSAWVFNGVNARMLNQIVIALKERHVMPLEVIVNEGDGSYELLWVSRQHLATSTARPSEPSPAPCKRCMTETNQSRARSCASPEKPSSPCLGCVLAHPH